MIKLSKLYIFKIAMEKMLVCAELQAGFLLKYIFLYKREYLT